MKVTIKLTGVLIIAMVFIWWVFQTKPDHKTQAKTNTVSFDVNQKTHNETTDKQAVREPLNAENSDSIEENHNSTAEADEKMLTWLSVYRMTRQFAQCEQVIDAYLRNQYYNPIQRMKDRVKSYGLGEAEEPTALQIQLIRRHFSQCKTLLGRIEDLLEEQPMEPVVVEENSKPQYQQIKQQLSQVLSAMQAVTSKEQRLAEVLKLKQQWQTAFDDVLAVSKGDDSQNLEQVAALRTEQQSNSQREREISALLNEGDTNEELSTEWVELNLRSSEIDAELMQLKEVDVELRTLKINEFNVFNQDLFTYLKSTDADVFFEVHITLEQYNSRQRNYFGYNPYKNIGLGQVKMPFTEYISPGDVIKEVTGLYDKRLLARLMNYATQLYWCELGGDCGADNLWVRQYCFNSYAQLEAESCGLDLVTFYQQHLLNANQWDDVQWLLGVIRELYAL